MKMYKRAIVTASLLSLAGCFPIAESYFEPSTPGIASHRRDCHGSTGPSTRIYLKTGNGALHVSSKRSTDQPQIVNVMVEFATAWEWEQVSSFVRRTRYAADESTLVIEPSKFKVFGKDPSAPINLASMSVHRLEGGKLTTLQIGPKLMLKATSPKNGTWASYRISLSFELGAQPEFVVVVPEISVDGITEASRTILFSEKNGVFVQPFNC